MNMKCLQLAFSNWAGAIDPGLASHMFPLSKTHLILYHQGPFPFHWNFQIKVPTPLGVLLSVDIDFNF